MFSTLTLLVRARSDCVQIHAGAGVERDSDGHQENADLPIVMLALVLISQRGVIVRSFSF